jgi:hypothetical protein
MLPEAKVSSHQADTMQKLPPEAKVSRCQADTMQKLPPEAKVNPSKTLSLLLTVS